MNEINVGDTIALTVPSTADHIAIVHEFGDVFYTTVSGTYSWNPTSIGNYSIYFVKDLSVSSVISPQPTRLDLTKLSLNVSTLRTLETFMNPSYDAIIDNTTTTVASSLLQGKVTTSTVVSTIFYNVVYSMVDFSTFSTDYPNFNNTNQFQLMHKKVRSFIENYTQQKFGPYLGKTLMIQGENGNSLPLDYPCLYMNSIQDQFGMDLTAECNISTISPFTIDHQRQVVYYDRNTVDYGYVDRKRDVSYRHGRFFSSNLKFFINGDFGYYYVPDNVFQAAELLIVDQLNGTASLRDHGIKSAQLGDYSYVLGEVDGTTGNIFADRLLSKYLSWNIALA